MKYILVILVILGSLVMGDPTAAARKINCEITVREHMTGADGDDDYVLIEKKK